MASTVTWTFQSEYDHPIDAMLDAWSTMINSVHENTPNPTVVVDTEDGTSTTISIDHFINKHGVHIAPEEYSKNYDNAEQPFGMKLADGIVLYPHVLNTIQESISVFDIRTYSEYDYTLSDDEARYIDALSDDDILAAIINKGADLRFTHATQELMQRDINTAKKNIISALIQQSQKDAHHD